VVAAVAVAVVVAGARANAIRAKGRTAAVTAAESAVVRTKLWAALDPLGVVARGACEARAGRRGVVLDPKSPKGARGACEAGVGRWGELSDPKSPKGKAVAVAVSAEASAARTEPSAALAASAWAAETVAGAGDDASLSTTMRRPPKVADVVITTPVLISPDSSEGNPAKSPAARGMAAAVGCAAVRESDAGRTLLPA